MVSNSLKQFKWRRNMLPFKLCVGVIVAVYIASPGVAQAKCDQQPAPFKQLSSQSQCQCDCRCLQSAPVHPHKRLHAHAPTPYKHIHVVYHVHPVCSVPSGRQSHLIDYKGETGPSYTVYTPLSSPPSYGYEHNEHKYPPLFIPKLDSQHKIIFQAGAFNSSQGRTQDVYINNVYDIYTITNHDSRNVLLGLGYYIDGLDKPRYSLWYGLNAFYLAPSTVKGDVIQEGLYPNLSYRYTVTQFPIYLDIKGIIHTNSPKYDITLDLAAGPSIVRTSNIEEYPLNSNSIPDRIFQGSTKVLPSASAGIGFKMNNVFSNKTSVECGYRFFYTAQTKFDNYFDSRPTSGPLYTGSNFVNAVMCSIIL